jgi:hypothetical protein
VRTAIEKGAFLDFLEGMPDLDDFPDYRTAKVGKGSTMWMARGGRALVEF